jgi:integrin beta 3
MMKRDALVREIAEMVVARLAADTALDPYCDDLDERYEDGGRWLVRRFLRQGVVVKELRHQTAALIDRGVWESGRAYQRGDAVSWGGSLFIAQQATAAKPGTAEEDSRAWRLAVKRGGEGKPGKPGPPGPPGPAAAAGRRPCQAEP